MQRPSATGDCRQTITLNHDHWTQGGAHAAKIAGERNGHIWPIRYANHWPPHEAVIGMSEDESRFC
jgi:hypothetical protein